jgi:hypothetical protein
MRKAVKGMTVASLGGKQALHLSSIRAEQQIPLVNAEGQVIG